MNSNRAVTFIELFIVIIIIGVLSAVAIPQFRKTFNRFQLDNFSRQLQGFMNYLSERAIVETKVIYLNIDNDKAEYRANIFNQTDPFKVYPMPSDIKIEAENATIGFYPDGSIDPVTIKVVDADEREVSLTTKGVFRGVKIQTE